MSRMIRTSTLLVSVAILVVSLDVLVAGNPGPTGRAQDGDAEFVYVIPGLAANVGAVDTPHPLQLRVSRSRSSTWARATPRSSQLTGSDY